MRKRMFNLVAIVFIILFTCLALRIAYLMLVRGQDLAARSAKQMSRSLDYYQYGRGDILDRRGQPFTSQREPCLVLIPAMLQNIEELSQSLSSLLELEEALIFSRLQAVKQQQIMPIIFKSGLSQEQCAALEEAQLPGLVVLNLGARYGQKAIAPHIIGSVQAGGEPSLAQGISGIEEQYDEELRGRVDDQVISWVDATGRLSGRDWRLLSPQHPYRRDVLLTLDLDYQQIAERALGDYQGACVIIDPYTGDILAAASRPGFDAYGWQPPATSDAFVNKAFAHYQPASTFKILLALAAADSGLPAAMRDFCCEGSTQIASHHTLNCWKRDGHGEIDLPQALAGSCNTYFANLGWEMGGQLLCQYMARCGLEQQHIVGYQAPALTTLSFNGAVPGDMANVSIGENGVRLSPLMVAQLVAICANGGYALSPRLVQEIRDQQGQAVSILAAEPPQRAVSEAAALQVASMLRLAVTEGTVRALSQALLPVAAKTGTSEEAGVWCAGFAPYEAGNKQAARWAIAVYVADGHSGGQEAAAVFKAVVDDLALLEGLV